jgi:phosphoserine aminotransferase
MPSYNFSAGPAAIPKVVLEEAKSGLTDWKGSGRSVMEIPFTGPEFKSILDDAILRLRELLDIPDNYHVLMLQGGAYGQFSFVPMNLLRGRERADYAVTGHWSKRAADEAGKYCKVNLVTDSSDTNFTNIESPVNWNLDANAAYCHITTNETANGVQLHELPETGDVPLIADVTSDLLTAPLDVSKFGVLYASAQKNMGAAGLTIVIVRDDLVGQAQSITPSVFDYGLLVDNNSKVNTPPTWAVYISGLVFKWVLSEGGLVEMARRNRVKAKLLYDVINAGDFYQCRVAQKVRSSVNVCFSLPNKVLEEQFLSQAAQSNLHYLEGHSAAGAIRASLYNAVEEEAVVALAQFMTAFASREGKG